MSVYIHQIELQSRSDDDLFLLFIFASYFVKLILIVSNSFKLYPLSYKMISSVMPGYAENHLAVIKKRLQGVRGDVGGQITLIAKVFGVVV